MGKTKMNTDKMTARIVGVLFILAIVVLFVGPALYNPYLNSSDYLEIAYPNKTTVAIGVLIEFIGYLGLIFIPILLFPILKKRNEVLALGYVCFRRHNYNFYLFLKNQ